MQKFFEQKKSVNTSYAQVESVSNSLITLKIKSGKFDLVDIYLQDYIYSSHFPDMDLVPIRYRCNRRENIAEITVLLPTTQVDARVPIAQAQAQDAALQRVLFNLRLAKIIPATTLTSNIGSHDVSITDRTPLLLEATRA